MELAAFKLNIPPVFWIHSNKLLCFCFVCLFVCFLLCFLFVNETFKNLLTFKPNTAKLVLVLGMLIFEALYNEGAEWAWCGAFWVILWMNYCRYSKGTNSLRIPRTPPSLPGVPQFIPQFATKAEGKL